MNKEKVLVKYTLATISITDKGYIFDGIYGMQVCPTIDEATRLAKNEFDKLLKTMTLKEIDATINEMLAD